MFADNQAAVHCRTSYKQMCFRGVTSTHTHTASEKAPRPPAISIIVSKVKYPLHFLWARHALSCPKGGFPSLRHNEVRDLTANLLSEVCNNVVRP